MILAAVLLALALAAGCSSSAKTGADSSASSSSSSEQTTTAAGSGTGSTATDSASSDRAANTDQPRPAAAGPFNVGRQSVTYVDKSRKTNADPMRGFPEKPERTLPVMLLYPAAGSPTESGDPTEGAPAAKGSFPFIVFSHGITASGPIYSVLVQRWARAGYVVAAPTYPLTSVGAKFPGDPVALTDYKNQPADVKFVIDSVLAQAKDAKDPLHGHVDASRIGAAGHSLGAITTIGLVYNSCCTEKRVKAAEEFSGAELPFDGGTFTPFPKTPLLIVHGAKDGTVPVAAGDKVLADATGPTWSLRYPDAGHVNAVFPGPYFDTTVKVSIDFWNAQLKGAPDALKADQADVQAGGLGTLTTKNG